MYGVNLKAQIVYIAAESRAPAQRFACAPSATPLVNGDREIVSILRVIHTARDWPNEEWPR